MKRILVSLLAAAALAACKDSTSPTPTPPPPAYERFTSQGDSAAVGDTLAAFRAALGGSLNAPNSAPADSGRREVNWDGVAAALTNVDTFPAGFFNSNSKRGVVFGTPGTGFRIDSTAFAQINPQYPSQFKAFSPKKLFMPVGSNQMTVDFKIVGSTDGGLVKGFGVVFTDVDRAGSTVVDFFDRNGTRIASITAPAAVGAHGFSFVGAVFASPVIAHVVITSGDAALSAATTDASISGTADLVVMDDFVYGEPQPLP